jgi:alanine dehydrogenase
MIIGTVKEIKDHEARVGLTPEDVKILHDKGHNIFIEHDAGKDAGFDDGEYISAGASILKSPLEVAKEVNLLIKVKEPLEKEYDMLKSLKAKALFTFLHLAAADKSLTLELMKNNITAIAYETVEDKDGNLPLLKPMSEIAGVVAIQYGAEFLQRKYKGLGLTLGNISSVDSATVVVIGAGIVGTKSAETALGMGCNVILLEKNSKRIESVKQEFSANFAQNQLSRLKVLASTQTLLQNSLKVADLLIGAVLVKGAKAPKVVTKEQLNLM